MAAKPRRPTFTVSKYPRWLTAAAATLLGLVTIIFGASPALASPHQGYTYWGPSTSYGYWKYDYDAPEDYLRLLSSPATLASGKCYDEILDWDPGLSHYDGRLARSCKSFTPRDTQVSH